MAADSLLQTLQKLATALHRLDELAEDPRELFDFGFRILAVLSRHRSGSDFGFYSRRLLTRLHFAAARQVSAATKLIGICFALEQLKPQPCMSESTFPKCPQPSLPRASAEMFRPTLRPEQLGPPAGRS